MKRGSPLSLAALLAAASLAVAAPPVLEPGNWMYSMETFTNGKAEPARTGEECLTDQLKDLGAFFAPRVEGADARCSTTRKGTTGNTIDYRLQCVGSGFTMDGVTSVTIQDSRRVTIRSQIA